MSLKDKVIFISGGSRGIGLAMVKKGCTRWSKGCYRR
jgi:NAD(P)-dependent dehydrogenase (short-subunit alcohol dehydrogenase family)